MGFLSNIFSKKLAYGPYNIIYKDIDGVRVYYFDDFSRTDLCHSEKAIFNIIKNIITFEVKKSILHGCDFKLMFSSFITSVELLKIMPKSKVGGPGTPGVFSSDLKFAQSISIKVKATNDSVMFYIKTDSANYYMNVFDQTRPGLYRTPGPEDGAVFIQLESEA